MTRFRLLSFAAVLLAVSTFTGCVDLKQTVVLNPDGSGKAHFKALMVVGMDFFGLDKEMKSKTSQEMVKTAVANELMKAKGVTSWKDVAFNLRKDGLMEFSGTAYFQDINEFQPYMQKVSEDFNKLEMSREGAKLVLMLRQKKGKSSDFFSSGNKEIPDDWSEFLLRQRIEFQQIKPIVKAAMEGMRLESHIKLPCQNPALTNFTKEGADGFSIVVQGKKIVEIMESYLMDDTKAKSMFIKPDGTFVKDPDFDKINQLLFGQAAPLKAVCQTAGKPLFDFQAESSTAAKAQEAMLKRLGLDTFMKGDGVGLGKAPVAKAAAGKSLKAVRLGGIRQNLLGEDAVTKFKPFNQSLGVAVSVIAEFGGAVLKTDRGKLTKAVSSKGEDLLGENEWDREFWSPNLNEAKDAAMFEVNLKAPKDPGAIIAEVSGTMKYQTSMAVKTVDLGFKSLEVQSKGKALGAVVEKMEPGYDQGERITIKINADYQIVKGMMFTTPDGKQLPVTSWGYSGGDTESSFVYNSEKPFPKNTKVTVEMYDKITDFEAPFTLKNIPLLPAK